MNDYNLDYTGGENKMQIFLFECLTKTNLNDWMSPTIIEVLSGVTRYYDDELYDWIEPFSVHLEKIDKPRYNRIQKKHDDNRKIQTKEDGEDKSNLWINSCEYCGHGIRRENFFIINNIEKLKMRIGSFCIKHFPSVLTEAENLSKYKYKLLSRHYLSWVHFISKRIKDYPWLYGKGYRNSHGEFVGSLYKPTVQLISKIKTIDNSFYPPPDTIKELKELSSLVKQINKNGNGWLPPLEDYDPQKEL